VVVEPILGVVNAVPVPIDVPPVATLYQFIEPVEATAPKVRVPASQRAADDVEVIAGELLTVAITAVRVGLVQPFSIAST
jgi:hypothetical protein